MGIPEILVRAFTKQFQGGEWLGQEFLLPYATFHNQIIIQSGFLI